MQQLSRSLLNYVGHGASALGIHLPKHASDSWVVGFLHTQQTLVKAQACQHLAMEPRLPYLTAP